MKKIILFITLSIILFNLVSAVPPFQFGSEVITKGLVIESPVYSTLKNSEDFHYNFHVFNATSGKLMDNTTTTCYFHLYDSTGDVIFSIYDVGMNGDEHTFEVIILGTNFTENKKGGFLTHCNTSDAGGFISGSFIVNSNGREPIIPNIIIQVGFIFLLFGIASLFLILSFRTEQPGIKLFFIFFSFILLMISLIFSFIAASATGLDNDFNDAIIKVIFAFGLILFVIFTYIMIEITKSSMDLFQEKKGYNVDF